MAGAPSPFLVPFPARLSERNLFIAGSTLQDMRRRWAGLLVVVVAFIAVVLAARVHARPAWTTSLTLFPVHIRIRWTV